VEQRDTQAWTHYDHCCGVEMVDYFVDGTASRIAALLLEVISQHFAPLDTTFENDRPAFRKSNRDLDPDSAKPRRDVESTRRDILIHLDEDAKYLSIRRPATTGRAARLWVRDISSSLKQITDCRSGVT
jgi:hypothetical protein